MSAAYQGGFFMSKLVQQATEQLRQRLVDAANAAMAAGALPQGDVPDFAIEVPADRTHGDYATNMAMVSAKTFRQAPRKIAEIITEHLDLSDTYLDRCEIAGPGFINFFLTPHAGYCQVRQRLRSQRLR